MRSDHQKADGKFNEFRKKSGLGITWRYFGEINALMLFVLLDCCA
jgi:hypothetical protein